MTSIERCRLSRIRSRLSATGICSGQRRQWGRPVQLARSSAYFALSSVQFDSCTRANLSRIPHGRVSCTRDTSAKAPRTWDDLVGLKSDVMAGSGTHKEPNLVEIERRLEAHRVAIDVVTDALDSEPADPATNSVTLKRRTGISNRESAHDEAEDRQAHPPLDTSSPAPEDAAGRTGEQPLEDIRDRHTSHKAGSRSIAQKEAASRYPDRSMPASRKVAGAFGKEPKAVSERDSSGDSRNSD